MKTLIISPSSMPTYCGVGKFSHKLAKALIQNDNKVLYIAKKDQKLKSDFNSSDVDYQMIYNNLDLFDFFSLLDNIKLFNPEKIIIQYNSAEMSKNYFMSFLPLLLKIRFWGKNIFTVIHEFNNFKFLGKLRNFIPALFSDHVYFSDSKNLESFNFFSKKFIKNKLNVIEIGPQVGNNFNKNKTNFDVFVAKLNTKKIVIGFHGLIQPKNDLLSVLIALNELINLNKNFRFELQILGDIKLLIDYGSYTQTVQDYQNKIKEFIDDNNLSQNITLLGDIEPSSNDFFEKAMNFDLFVVPDIDGVTPRRTSFWNVFVQSKAICILSKKDSLEPPLDQFLTYDINYTKSLTSLIKNIINQEIDIKKIIKTQDTIRDYYNLENTNQRLTKFFIR